jgi:hypothetical protein
MTTKAKRVEKSIAYKRANFHRKPTGENLKSLLEKALVKHETWGKRRLNIADSDTPIYHVVGNQKCETNGFVFGVLMTYTPGVDPLYLVDDETANEIKLEKLSAPLTDDGKRREFLASMMYFGVIRDHLVMIQSQSLKAPQLESYLQWLLHDSEVLAGDNTFQLVDTPSRSVREKMEKGNGVKTITLGAEVIPQSVFVPKADGQEPSASNEVARKTTTQHSHNITVVTQADDGEWGPLAALKRLMAPSQAAKIDFAQLDGSNIEMSVTLKYKRETTESGQKLMDTLGHALRNTEDVETVLTLNGGGSIRGADLKLNGSVRLTSYDGQLSADEVFEEMRQWLLSKVTSEELSAS